MYTERFRTPRGQPVTMEVRPDSVDHNVLYSCLDEDEYGLRNLHPEGWALDVGAYTGGVTVALAVDNPELQVVAIEPVPENVELLIRNLSLNGVLERVRVIEGAAGSGGQVEIHYDYKGSEVATHHAFIGNITLLGEPSSDTPHRTRRLKSLRMDRLGVDFAFAKIDCEGCEWLTFRSMKAIPRIHGEVHPVPGHTDPQGECLAILGATHQVTFSGPKAGPCGFVATRHD